MDTQDFLRQVLGYDGHYCVFAARDGSVKQKFYPNIDAVAGAARQFDDNGFDTYFALATFKDDTSREITNALQMRSFFLDLDCGDTKPFQDQGAAINALKQFVKWNNLPHPTLVNSGRGIHVYWTLREPVPAEKWRAAAESLKKLCREQEFAADPAITADVARVLRIPGSRNFKDTPPKPVVVLGRMRDPVDFDAFVSKLPEPDMELVLSPAVRALVTEDPLAQRLLGNKVSKFSRIMKRTLAGDGCEQLKYAVTHQKDLDEPLWRAALSVAWHCEDNEKSIHNISKRDPRYDPDETKAKAISTKGPYRCDRFDDLRPGVCQDCKFWGKIGSPITLGQEIKEGEPLKVANGTVLDGNNDTEGDHVNGHAQTTYSEIKLPRNYFRPVGGGVARKDKGEPDEDGNATEVHTTIYHNDLYVTRRVNDPESGENLVWRLHLPKDEPREFTVPLEFVTSREEFRKALSRQGVPAYKKRLDLIMEYASAWTENLQEIDAAEEAHRQFGWADYKTMDSFVLGRRKIFADRVEDNPPSVSTAGYAHAFEPEGNEQEWKGLMNFYNRPGMEIHQMIIGICAGAPLMALTALHGGILHLFSDKSGVGKTTTSLAGLSLWGDPDKIISHQEDTLNSRMHRAELFCNLPVVMDEITNITPEQASQLTYQVTNGYQRSRLQGSANRERWRGRPWHTIMVTTANSSLFDKLTSTKMTAEGETRRVMEYEVQRTLFNNKSETDNFAESLKHNHGFAGEHLVQSYLQNMNSTKNGMQTLRTSIDVACGLKAEDRFYSAMTAAALVGLQHLKSMGMVEYDLVALKEWVIKTFVPGCLGNMADLEMTMSRVLNDYVNVDNYGAVLRIRSSDTGVGTTPLELEQLTVPDKQPGFRFVARYETDTKVLFLIPAPFKKWCTEKQISYHSITKQLQKEYGARMVKKRLNKGTRFDMPATQAWEIHLNEGSGFK